MQKVDTRWNLLCTMLQKLDSRLNLLSKLMQKIGLLRTMFQNVGTLLIVKFCVHDVCRRSKYDTISFAQFRRKYIGTSLIQGTPLFRGHLHSGHTKFGPEKTLTCYLYWRSTSIQRKETLFLSSETRVQPPFRAHVHLNAQKVSDHKNNW